MKLLLIGALILAAALAAAAFWIWTPDRSRAKLEATYLRSPADMIEMGGFRLHVRDTGPRDAPTLVMLHGFGASLHTFEPWAQALENSYRVIRLDLPGSGLSEPDPTGVYTDARSIELLTALIDRLGIDRATLIGNSIGGRLAWTFAAAHPDRVDKVVLISPDGFASAGFEYGRTPEIPATMNLMRFALPKALLRQNLVVAYANPNLLTDEVVERYHAMMLAPGSRAALIARMEQTVLHDPAPRLRTIKSPVLLLWGEKDAMIPAANAADYARVLPDSKLIVLPGLGHVPHEESPEISLAPVRDFLAR